MLSGRRFEGPLSGSQDAVAGVLNDPDTDPKTKAIAKEILTFLTEIQPKQKIARDLRHRLRQEKRESGLEDRLYEIASDLNELYKKKSDNQRLLQVANNDFQQVEGELSHLIDEKEDEKGELKALNKQLKLDASYKVQLEEIGQRHDLEEKVVDGTVAPTLDDLGQLQALSPTKFQYVVIQMLQQKNGQQQLFKLATACLTDQAKHPMVHQLYDIAVNDTRTSNFSRRFFKHLSRHYGVSMAGLFHQDASGQPLKERAMPSTMVSFILNGNQSSKNLTRLQDLIQGFRQGF